MKLSVTKVSQSASYSENPMLMCAVLIFSNTVRLLKMINEFIIANCEFATVRLSSS